jgi:uncharacterized protein
MFNSLPKYLKDNALQGDVRTLLFLKKGIERGLVHTLGDLYLLLKGLVTNSPKDFGPFTTAFYQYFLDIDIKKGESLDNAIARSEAFKNWRNNHESDEELERQLNNEQIKELVNDFINDVHFTSFDIQNMLKGEDILQNDDPNRADTEGSDDAPNEVIKRMADYNNISVEELLERMKQVAAQQKRRHSGGSHWIGTGGNSPYGHNGAGDGGVRVGGSGGGKMARAVLEDRNYFPVDTKKILQDDTIDVALAFLKGIEDESVERFLDIPMTISEGVKQGGVFLPFEREKIDQKVQVLLLIDNGGWSMSPYVDAVTKLFSKMKRRFAHDLKTYYFHNTIYGEVYKDEFRSYSQLERVEALCKLDKNFAVFIIGDADMGPYELTPNSIASWQKIKDHFERIIWLNPTEQKYWSNSNTIIKLSEQFEMFPLSPFGIEKGVEAMNKKRRFSKAF